MLRFTFIIGYGILLMSLIAVVAIKVISLGQNASWGESPMVDYSRVLDRFISDPSNIKWIAISVIAFVGLWVYALRTIAKRSPMWEKTWVKTLTVGCGIMMCFFVILAIVGFMANFTSGIIKETAARIAGLMSSPVIMEASFFFIGLTLLFTYNIFRRKLDGDDFVEMEIPDHINNSEVK